MSLGGVFFRYPAHSAVVFWVGSLLVINFYFGFRLVDTETETERINQIISFICIGHLVVSKNIHSQLHTHPCMATHTHTHTHTHTYTHTHTHTHTQ